MNVTPSIFEQHLKLFRKKPNRDLLCCNLRGVERETLRVTPNGTISHESHPHELGSALAHPLITTDFSEALLEFITEPYPKISDLLEQLTNTHKFTAEHLPGSELLWPCSMPCILNGDRDIPIAQYGSSNVGMMKTIYRRGLGHRYGRKMQAIAGIHFNFSVPDAVWSRMRASESSLLTLQEYRTLGYMGLVRNFRRRFWLLLYLMGASPVTHKSFVAGRNHDLEPLGNDDVYLPHATTLRMGDLGYQSSAQDDLYVCYNSVESYVQSLKQAIIEGYEPYRVFNSTAEADELEQLSPAVLQIENEFYSTIRPKQTTRTGETQLKALKERGVEYIEVRCVDINPFEPLGISREQIQFLELFLLGCLFDSSPETHEKEYREGFQNQRTIVRQGRKPGLELMCNGQTITMTDWANDIMSQLKPIAKIMDKLKGSQGYSETLANMEEMIANPELTPSAQILKSMEANNQSFIDWSLSRAQEHTQSYQKQDMNNRMRNRFQSLAKASLDKQESIEKTQTESLSEYIREYFNQYQQL